MLWHMILILNMIMILKAKKLIGRGIHISPAEKSQLYREIRAKGNQQYCWAWYHHYQTVRIFLFSNKKITTVSIYQNAEDDTAKTIKPKLEVYKANCNNVCYIEKGDELLLINDKSIAKAIVESGAKLFVFDPLQAFIGDHADWPEQILYAQEWIILKEMAQLTGSRLFWTVIWIKTLQEKQITET